MSTLRNIVSTDCKLKVCKTCKELLPITDFNKCPTSKDRLFYSCKKCYRIYRNNQFKNKTKEQKEEHNRKNRIQYSKNKEKKAENVRRRRKNNPQQFKNASLKYHFGITIETYDQMLANQKNCCAICKVHQSDLNYSLAVDHCHKTDVIRGLLCRNCNLALGYFKDNVESIKNSVTYLEKFKEYVNS